MSDTPAANAAYFTGPGSDTHINVQFNPASLRVTLTNQFGEDPPEQHARATTAKLDVELIFDTTENGIDVRDKVKELRGFATAIPATTGKGKPKPANSGATKDEANLSLPKITFHWGTASYTGIIESLTETLDYWSSDGVPLRATIQLSIKGDGKAFFDYKSKAASYFSASDPAFAPPDVIVLPAEPKFASLTAAATRAGDPKAGRALAAFNGVENMRAGGGATAMAGASANLSAAAGFSMSGGVSAGASIGFGMGASAGLSASAGIGGSVGVGMAAGAGGGIGGGAGFSAGAGFGASAGAGFSASGGFSAGASASAGFGAGASFGMGSSMGGTGMSMSGSGGFGGASDGGGGFFSSTTTSVTGFDGVTRTDTSSSFTGFDGTTRSSSSSTTSFGGSSAGVRADEGAFAGLGMSKTTSWGASYQPERLLPPPPPMVTSSSSFDVTGRLVGGGAVVAESYTSRSVTFF
ncbi:hypothetical protein MZO42_16270 [Sphingomonas psychrotolerans]|uniref:Contractile injection system tube protein N-terminal domain-containing protein n=1 Tax=Sphingomonas psychrotolerans TaxID=1327635 RepID=A0ABU3N6U7_9SPHN|nr:hypothetical protein [Sphingomonas psychrotolerans]MDT8760257.1 hypothetical protein [Sphingomonas psychrotolerans]